MALNVFTDLYNEEMIFRVDAHRGVRGERGLVNIGPPPPGKFQNTS
jgi:hypothetical protein